MEVTMRVLSSAIAVASAAVAMPLLAIAVKAAVETVYGPNVVDEFFIVGPSVVIVVWVTVFLAGLPVKKRLAGRKVPPGYRWKFHQLIIPMVISIFLLIPGWAIIDYFGIHTFGIDTHWWRKLWQWSTFAAGMTAGFCWWYADAERAAMDGAVSRDSGDGEG